MTDLFSIRLKELIKNRLGTTQKAFAKSLGLTESFLSDVINKKSGPSADMIASLYIHYGEYLSWLLKGEENDYVEKCPFCGQWSDEVKEACRKLQEIMESGDEDAKKAILNTLNVYWNSIEKKGKRKAKKDLPDVQPEAPLRAGKEKQTAAK